MRLSFSLPRRRAAKPLLAAATLALLAGCANGFDPLKIVIAPVTELMNQLDGMDKKSEQKQDESKGQNKDQNGTTQPVNARQVAATSAAPIKATTSAKTPAASVAKPATWNGLPVGEMSVDGISVLVVSATSGTAGYDTSLVRYRSLAENEGVLHVRNNKSRLCYGTSGLPALSSAYLDDDGTIVNITDMQANSSGECAQRPVARVLTMPYQWFSQNGIRAGDKVTDFKPVTTGRQAEIVARFKADAATREQVRAQRKAEEDKRKAEEAKQLAAQEKLKNEQKVKAARTADFLRLQTTRKKPDIALADMREVSTPSGSLLALIKEPLVCTGGFISFCEHASKYDRGTNHSASKYDLKAYGPYPLLPNEALLFMEVGKVRHWRVSDISQPISVAFITEAGRIIEIQSDYTDKGNAEMEGKTYGDLWAKSPAHALITNVGWFDEHQIKAGDTITFKPVTAKRRDELYAQGMAQAERMLAQRIQDDKQQARAEAVARAKAAGGNIEQLLQAGMAHNHNYVCEKEEAQGLLYVQSREADGSVNAVYDLAVADIAKNTVTGVRVQMKGVKNAEGGYDFTPVNTLKSAPQLKVNGIRAFGNLAELDVNLSGSACGTPEQMGLWAKVPDAFSSVKMPVSVNLANRALHRADFYYKANREATRLPDGARASRDSQDHLGIRLVAAGRAPLPGEPATTGQMFHIDIKTDDPGSGSTGRAEGRKIAGEFTLSRPCAEPRSAYQCLHSSVVVGDRAMKGRRLQPKTGDWQNYTTELYSDDSSSFITDPNWRSVTEMELFNSMVHATKSEKVSWTPLDFAPQFEVASYQIQPGQPSASESLINLRYRYARYVYLYSRVMMQEKEEAFLQHYAVKITGKQDKKRAMSADEAKIFLLADGASRSMCSDRTFTVSITPKTATARRDGAVDIDWTMVAERLEGGRPAIERRIHAAHYALNAKNGYSAKDTITFPCVTDAQESQTRVWIFKQSTSIQLKDVKFGADIVRVYE